MVFEGQDWYDILVQESLVTSSYCVTLCPKQSIFNAHKRPGYVHSSGESESAVLTYGMHPHRSLTS